MKNIHVIPTSSPSKIFYIAENFHLEKGQLIEPKSYYHIYITNDEEIKEGDYVIWNGKVYKDSKRSFTGVDYSQCKKIILTTDQDLIKDGVQSIDDSFLEWFVKNPSCEEVKVQKEKQHIGEEIDESYPKGFFDYKIIIPKEEPKQEKWDKLNKELDDALEEAFSNTSNILDGDVPNAKLVLREYLIANKEEVVKDLEQMREWSNTNKQETLEEAAIKYATNHGMMAYVFPEKRESFIDGAKWQAERMYSEEEVYHILCEHTAFLFAGGKSTLSDWFEQFKKK
jgi:hypothetical protein